MTPARAAEIIVNTVKRDNPPLHLLLGVTAVGMALDYSRRQLAEATAWQNVSRSADYAEPYPAEYPADAPSNQSLPADRRGDQVLFCPLCGTSIPPGVC